MYDQYKYEPQIFCLKKTQKNTKLNPSRALPFGKFIITLCLRENMLCLKLSSTLFLMLGFNIWANVNKLCVM